MSLIGQHELLGPPNLGGISLTAIGYVIEACIEIDIALAALPCTYILGNICQKRFCLDTRA